MFAGHLRAAQRCRWITLTVALFFLLGFLPAPPDPLDGGGNRRSGTAHLSSPLWVTAAAELLQCAQIKDLENYGVNLHLFPPDTIYLKSEFFCAESAPNQYRCRCSPTTTCKSKLDPWGRNIGSCECCSPWVITCFVILCMIFVICILAAVYAGKCQGEWWCDGYPIPRIPLMPRRGQAVSCPPSLPLPQNLFYGYPSTNFTNIETSRGRGSVSSRGVAEAPLEDTPYVADVDHISRHHSG
ncbi:hypothetical protein JKF63_01727 [Porcisia hertigi]|uniref:Uncharacterized protein n=1 Tax=Porcisia hertigi TaxID=2761500 RepID=A0A836L481_9TRYP|nr:hypothetical protein JKF63_01727 [Porcisia hertigi]